MKVLKRANFSEGQHSVFSKVQCVRATIAKLRCPILLHTFCCLQRQHKQPLNSLSREAYEQKSLSAHQIFSLMFPIVKSQLFFPHHKSRSSCNCCCLQFPSISYVIREKYGSISPSPKLHINLTQSIVKSARKVSLIFTDAASGVVSV